MVQLVTVATCHINQWALDFDLNVRNVKTSIVRAKELGCAFRTGPELELSGYGCEDHFLEQDTIIHCWESVLDILKSGVTIGILCDIGMPVMHRNVRYNCRIFILNNRILLIRPKVYLADDGNYRESRWFTPWKRMYDLDDYILPKDIVDFTQQDSVKFGVAIIECDDTTIASETCEELFTPDSPDISLTLAGAEIIANGSGSHHNLRKLNVRLDLIRNATSKGGGCYLYANQQGCDGGRLYYDGCASVMINGMMLAQGSQFSVHDVEVVHATIDLDDIRSYRASIMSRSQQAATVISYPRIRIRHRMVRQERTLCANDPIQIRLHSPAEEIALGPACWLWDYMRRSGATGFLLPLSGGADSAAVCTIVGSMCQLIVKALDEGDAQVMNDVRRVAARNSDDDMETWKPKDARDLANRLLHTVYMSTSNSGEETRNRARRLAEEVGAFHLDVNIDDMINATIRVFAKLTFKTPKFKAHGGSGPENLALQNIQARLRMVFAYLCASLFPWVRGSSGFLLTLGSGNVDEALRGYMTKYDCSSADINPIGSISKGDLKMFLLWASEHFGYKTLIDIVQAKPTAELEPITDSYSQTDEEDMNMTYEELGIYGRLRKIYRCGPVSMYNKLVAAWTNKRDLTPSEIGKKVKDFFYFYGINRHKMTTLTPSYHAENYSPDDNRFDMRQFLYNGKWKRQFECIDELVKNDTTDEKPSKPELL